MLYTDTIWQRWGSIFADVFFKSGLMEAWGRGIANIFEECEKYGLPVPEFKVGHRIVTLVIRFKNAIVPHKKGE